MGRSDEVMGTMVNGPPSCDGPPPSQAAKANKICSNNDQSDSMLSSARSSLAFFSTPDPSPFSSSVTPLAALVTSKEHVGELPGGDIEGDPMVIGNELGSVVAEPPGDGHEGTLMVTGIELGSVVGEPPGSGEEGTPLATGFELGP